MWIACVKLVLSFCVFSAVGRSTLSWGNAPPSEASLSTNDIKLRHHSRFPNLDRVMMRIDSMQNTKKTLDPFNKGNKVRHQGWSSGLYRSPKTTTTTTTPSEGLFGEEYGEYDEDEQSNEYDEWEDDESTDDYEDETDEGNLFSGDNENEWQAEEATERASEAPVIAPVSSMTKFKWDNYGTRSRVEESRRQQLHLKPSAEFRATSAVVEHYMKVRQEGQCRRPQPKVISVQSEHPDPSKTYTPHCTILHRCAEDTGCCSTFDTKCGPRTQVPVHLYFYSKTLGVPEMKVERLLFYNHTECACLEKSKFPTSTEKPSPHSGLALRSAAHPENFQKKCKCPEEFSPKFRYDSGCSCDCQEHNQDCLRMKKGKEFFSLTDRMCIMEKECGIPACEYGAYLRQIGRCPRKQEKLESYRKFTLK